VTLTLKKMKKKRKTQQHSLGTNVIRFSDLMPDYWLEFSLHPEGPVISQLDQGFPWYQSKC
jgi:hypothetical protein